MAVGAIGCGIYAFRLMHRYGWPENTAVNFIFRKRTSGLNKKRADVISVGPLPSHNYSTTFPVAEDPLAEGSTWVEADKAGAGCDHHPCWGDMQTISGEAFPYCHIASWGGPNGAWVNLDECQGHSAAQYLKDGDVLKATVSGTNPVTITEYINGIQVLKILDDGTCTFSDGKKHGPWTTGNPGIGQYDTMDSDFRSFGWSSFSATDGFAPAVAKKAETASR
jgi:hypothetical protein